MHDEVPELPMVQHAQVDLACFPALRMMPLGLSCVPALVHSATGLVLRPCTVALVTTTILRCNVGQKVGNHGLSNGIAMVPGRNQTC